MPTGVVSKVSGREWDDPQQGKVILYSLQLTGDTKFYRTGQNDPASVGAVQGANVSFDLTPKGNVVFKSIKLLSGAPQVTRSPAATGVTTTASSSKNDYWETKEKRDVARDAKYQDVDIPRMTFCGAQEAAVKVVELALVNGALDLGTAKKAAKMDILMAAIDKVANELFRARLATPTMTELAAAEAVSDNNNEETTEDADEDE